jgi:hypothetical protein
MPLKYKIHDIYEGMVIGRLLVTKLLLRDKKGVNTYGYVKYTHYALCTCSCGKSKKISLASLQTGNSTSCGCATRADGFSFVDYEPGVSKLFNWYQKAAKEKNRSFKLDPEEFYTLIKGNCTYCGTPPMNRKKRYDMGDRSYILSYNGIDRIDSSKGYVKGNVTSCCTWCNTMKLDLTLEQFKEHVTKLAELAREGKW